MSRHFLVAVGSLLLRNASAPFRTWAGEKGEKECEPATSRREGILAAPTHRILPFSTDQKARFCGVHTCITPKMICDGERMAGDGRLSAQPLE